MIPNHYTGEFEEDLRTPQEKKRDDIIADIKFGCALVTGSIIALNLLQTWNEAEEPWYPKVYDGGRVEVTFEDGFSVTHTSNGEDEHYILFDYGVQNPYKVSERIQQMIDREEMPQTVDYAIFFSDATRKIIDNNTTLQSRYTVDRYDADYSTQLFHANAHQHLLPSGRDKFYLDGVSIQYNSDGIMADNGISCIVCSSDENLWALASDLITKNPKDMTGETTRLKREDMHIIVQEGAIPAHNITALQNLGATVETISESRTAVLDENGYHMDLSEFDLDFAENELDKVELGIE